MEKNARELARIALAEERLPYGEGGLKSTKGRASHSNASGRYERYARVELDDGWGSLDEDPPPLRTTVLRDQARTIITRNQSPDISFDRSINPYRGCEHGCIYCFARPTHAYMGLSPGLDFESTLYEKPHAAQLLERELQNKNYKPRVIAIGTNTDPYQPIEKIHKIMRECLKVLQRYRHPVAIVTKGTLIERDLDILGDMAAQGLVRVGVSVTTLDAKLSRLMEPRVPAPARRLRTIECLVQAGVPVRLMASPVVPALTDPELESILAAGQRAGATSASWIMLRLPREVSELVQEWLARHFPDRAGRIMGRLREMHGGADYDSRWGHRMRGEGPYAQIIARRFEVAARRLGLDQHQPALRCDLFAPGAQPSLF